MLITKELIMSLLVVFGIGKYSEIKSAKHYEMITDEGKTYRVLIDNNKKYACPLDCGANHYHKTMKIDEDNELFSDFYTVKGFGSDDIYLNSYVIVDMEHIKMNKDKKPEKLKKLNVQTYLP